MFNIYSNKKVSGFTLFEILLSVSLVGMISVFAIPLLQSFIFTNQLDENTIVTAKILRTAQTYSQAQREDSTWGVRISTNAITLFKGTSYTSRDQSFDLLYSFTGTTLSGPTEIIYAKRTGVPSTTSTITLTRNNKTKQITQNAKGTLTF